MIELKLDISYLKTNICVYDECIQPCVDDPPIPIIKKACITVEKQTFTVVTDKIEKRGGKYINHNSLTVL